MGPRLKERTHLNTTRWRRLYRGDAQDGWPNGDPLGGLGNPGMRVLGQGTKTLAPPFPSTASPSPRLRRSCAATLTVRSHLLPMSMMVMLGLACCRASSSQLARWLKVSRLLVGVYVWGVGGGGSAAAQ